MLKEITGDHVAEFARIMDYRDMLLKINSGSTCAVKLTVTNDGVKQFSSFYICFAAMKKGFMEGCRRCIGVIWMFFEGYLKRSIVGSNSKGWE